jgi:hypothetical protein
MLRRKSSASAVKKAAPLLRQKQLFIEWQLKFISMVFGRKISPSWTETILMPTLCQRPSMLI